MSDLQAGNPTIQVSANGFATVTRQVTLTAGKQEFADFRLEPNSFPSNQQPNSSIL